MEIGRIQGVAAPTQTTGSAAARGASGFADLLGQAINQLQSVSDNADAKVAALRDFDRDLTGARTRPTGTSTSERTRQASTGW